MRSRSALHFVIIIGIANFFADFTYEGARGIVGPFLGSLGASAAIVGFVAGLVPCPLTLFAMFLALGRGVPEAGLMFALAMMLGVGLTLSAIALLTIFARDAVVGLMARHGASLDRLARTLDALGGLLLIVFAAYEIWR